MNPTILSTINNWTKGGIFSFEKRLSIKVDPSGRVPSNTLPYNFIIDVNGLFEDEAHTKPIKLHYEKVLDIDDLDMTPQYASAFAKRLDSFTQSAYASFKQILASYEELIFTSDPLHMKLK